MAKRFNWAKFGGRAHALLFTAVAIVSGIGCRKATREPAPAKPAAPPASTTVDSTPQDSVERLIRAEELILDLTPLLRLVSRSAMNLSLPDGGSSHLFADRVTLEGDWARGGESDATAEAPAHPWIVADQSRTVSRDELKVWPALIDSVAFFDRAGFYFVSGDFADATTTDHFQSVLGFDGLAKYRDGPYASLHADLEVGWMREQDAAWRIYRVKLKRVSAVEARRLLFRDVLDRAVADADVRRRARISRHEQITSALLTGKSVDRPEGDRYPFFFPDVTLEHPGVAIIDIDADGFDDLYVGMQQGRNLLFRNRGDGTFEETAADYGLDIRADTTSAAFADFDNDGDPDLFIGRARHRGRYLVNEGGKFVDRSAQLVNIELPFMVSSISAADYNSDGLLDVYLCTYSPIEVRHQMSTQRMPDWVRMFLTPEQGSAFATYLQDAHSFLGRVGPPNVLLKNVGHGAFEQATEGWSVEGWRKSFQAAWSDYDRDGDPDLYVSNDYAVDSFYRNEGGNGFTDVTEASGLARMGFGMGVSFADYDNDGRLDLYLSNMYSKAGQRITARFDGLDGRFRQMAEGNYLYRRDGAGFKLVSGPDESDMHVAKAGWSWGGQFTDFNNDGFSDIYVASGYYSAPPDVAVDLDL